MDGWPDNPVLVEVWRSGFFESAHRGSFVVLDAAGAVTFAAGAAELPRTGGSTVGSALGALALLSGLVCRRLLRRRTGS